MTEANSFLRGIGERALNTVLGAAVGLVVMEALLLMSGFVLAEDSEDYWEEASSLIPLFGYIGLGGGAVMGLLQNPNK